jgi:hypothetical protein
MAEDRIDNYIDRSGVQGDTDFMLSALRQVYSEFKKLETIKVDLRPLSGLSGIAPVMSQAKVTADAMAAATQTVSQRIAQLNGSSKEFTQVLYTQVKAQKEAAATSLLEAKAANEVAKAKREEAKASGDAAKAKAAEKKITEDAINDYLQLSKAYNEAALKAKNYALRLGEDHPITVQAIKDANDMGNVLKRLDAAVGQNQRNVGNYKSAFNGLGLSFTQVARELPSLTVSFQQFALAISNNLPMVQDEIKKAKQEIAALRAEGKETPSLFSKIKDAILSPQVALSVAITLFTAFAGKLFGASNASKKLREEQKELTAAIKDQIDALKDQIDVYNDLDNEQTKQLKRNSDLRNAAGKSTLANDIEIAKEQNKIAKERVSQAAIQFGLNEKEAKEFDKAQHQLQVSRQFALDDLRQYLNESIEARHRFFNSGKKDDKEEADLLQSKYNNAKATYDNITDLLDNVADTNNDVTAAIIKKNKELDDQAAEIRKRNEQADYERGKIILQQSIDLNKEIADDEKQTLTNRLLAFNAYVTAKANLIDFEYAHEVKKAGLTSKEVEKIEADHNDKMLRLAYELGKGRIEIVEKFNNEFHKDEKELRSKLEKVAEDGFKKFESNLKERQKKEKETADESIKNEEDLAKKKFDLYVQLANNINELTFTLFTRNIEKQKNAIQEQIDALEARKQKEIEIANQTIVGAQDRAAAIAIIEARAAAQKEALQKKQRDLDIKKAQFDKAQAIARVVQETAVGLLSLLADPNPPTKALIPLFVATAAAQLASVVAQPIPRYKHGKNVNDMYEGPAIVGDGGRKEAIVREDGSIEITKDTPQLTYVKKRDIVLPDASKVVNYMVSNGTSITESRGNANTSVEVAIHSMKRDVVDAIKKIPQPIIRAENILSRRIRHGDSSNIYLNKNLQF